MTTILEAAQVTMLLVGIALALALLAWLVRELRH